MGVSGTSGGIGVSGTSGNMGISGTSGSVSGGSFGVSGTSGSAGTSGSSGSVKYSGAIGTGCGDEHTWPDLDDNLVCGECKVLVRNMKTKYYTCSSYCSTIGRTCTGAWEEKSDTCRVKSTEDCEHNFGSYTSDAICECGGVGAVGTTGARENVGAGGHGYTSAGGGYTGGHGYTSAGGGYTGTSAGYSAGGGYTGGYGYTSGGGGGYTG